MVGRRGQPRFNWIYDGRDIEVHCGGGWCRKAGECQVCGVAAVVIVIKGAGAFVIVAIGVLQVGGVKVVMVMGLGVVMGVAHQVERICRSSGENNQRRQ
jgi:hypothetical protein